MSKLLDVTLKFLSYEGQSTNDPSDTISIKNRVQESDVSECFRYKTKISDATVDKVITLPDANSDYLLIFTDQTISAKLNSSSDAITLSPIASGKKSFVYYAKGNITALSISNSSGNDANVDIIAVNS